MLEDIIKFAVVFFVSRAIFFSLRIYLAAVALPGWGGLRFSPTQQNATVDKIAKNVVTVIFLIYLLLYITKPYYR